LDVCPHTAQANDNGNLLSYDEYAGGPGFAQPAHVNQTFAYDGVNRLTMAQETGSWGRTFDYDQWGNIAVTTPNNVVPLNVNTATSLNQYNANNQRSDLGQGYDAAGNQTLMNPQITLTYDAENRQTAASGGYTYTYDGAGRRVMKVGGGVTTVFVYDAMGELAAEYSNAANTSPCLTCYLSYDHLGTTRLVTDASGRVVSRHDYLPFGEEIPSGVGGRDGAWGSGADGVNQKFTGKERDAESGLDYFGARYYGGALGRFTSPDDPSNDQDEHDPQSWSLYSYVRSNPLRSIDPNGEDCITTSNQTSSGVAVTTERGGSADTCSGTYVNGTVDVNSFSYNGTSLGYSFSNDAAAGAGTISFGSGQSDNADWGPGSSNMLGAAQIGGSQALVNEFMKQAAIGAAAGVAGRLIGAGIEALLAARAARAAAAAVDVANLSNKIVRQMASRGWTAQEIVDTVQNGKAYSVLNKATGGAATEYVNPASGKFVVVDSATKQVLQVSGPGFSPNHLVP
jgi:RHS repeat-associated protein